MLTAAQLDLVAEFAQRRPAGDVPPLPGRGGSVRWTGVSEFASAEIACVLRRTARGADTLLTAALGLEQLPATAADFRAGELHLRRVQALQCAVANLPDAEAAQVEAAVLPRAAAQTLPQLGRAARRAALRVSPKTAEERHQATVADRWTWLEHDGDGRSRFTAEGPTHNILRLSAAVDAVARTREAGGSGGGDGGASIDQRRFDALSQMANTILDDPRLPKTRFGRPGIVLLADLGALARLEGRAPADPEPDATETGPGTDSRPVELLGDGPIHDALASALFGDRHTVLITVDRTARWTCDHTVGYQVPDRLARYLTGLHPRCAFPGCGVPAHRCDWDHAIPWPTGPACACNLLPLCRRHHRLKTHGQWQLTLHRDRRAEWTSPTGRRYVVYPGGHADDDSHQGGSEHDDSHQGGPDHGESEQAA